jgi:hypothetical protein
MSETKNPNAFPLSSYAIERGAVREEDHPSGMTLRDYFAAKALAGILSGNEIIRTGKKTSSSIASYAYSIADAMLKQREL